MLSRIARLVISSGHPLGAFLKSGLDNPAAMDLFFRAAFLEGYLNLREGSVSRSPARFFRAATEALETGEENSHVDALKARNIPEESIAWLVSPEGTHFYKSVVRVVSGFLNKSPYKRVSVEDVLNGVAGGMNPFVNDDSGLPNRIPRFKGHGGLYFIGMKFAESPEIWNPNKIQTYLQQICFNLIKDSWRIKRHEELLFDNQVGDDDEESNIVETVAYEPPPIEFSEILNNPRLKSILNREVQEELRTDNQQAIWQVIMENPDLIRFKEGQEGAASVNNKEVVDRLKLRGIAISEMGVSKAFKEVVLPAMLDATASSTFKRTYDDLFDIASTYRKEISRRAKKLARRYASLKNLI
jgi:hypothetical protein